jgi:peptidyl-dipeptidase Dcp
MMVGNGVDPGEAYRNFRGADPKIDGLLRARGFAPLPNPGSAKQIQAE